LFLVVVSQAHTNVHGAVPNPQASAAIKPAVLEPSTPYGGGASARPMGGALSWEAEELRKRQEELDRKAEELQRREQEMNDKLISSGLVGRCRHLSVSSLKMS